MAHPYTNRHVVPTIVLTRSRLVSLNVARPITTAVPQTIMPRPRPSKHIVNKPHSPLRRPISHRPSPKTSNFPHKRTTVKAKHVMFVTVSRETRKIQVNDGLGPQKTLSFLFHVQENPQQALKDKGVIDSSKFNGKADEGFLVGYSVSSKAFRVFNSRTRIVQETLHINFLENQPNVTGSGPTWLFDIDTLTQSMNYQPVYAENQPNSSAGIQEHFDAVKEPESEVYVSLSSSAKTKKHDDKTKREAKGKNPVNLSTGVRNLCDDFLITSLTSPALGNSSYVDPSQYPDDPNMPALEDITYSDDEED
nr:retrovirus-related Pol polyprotein from transposon TNT 1-94 [Tanacetum cinerariifolium]GEZ93044.1 retrovirus-related Pol polyprotein from transposon TNT 1-94 [Tanacetum cinerariifolium]